MSESPIKRTSQHLPSQTDSEGKECLDIDSEETDESKEDPEEIHEGAEDESDNEDEFADLEDILINEEFLEPTQQVDYNEIFSYLGKSVKQYDFSMNSYASYDAPEHVEQEEDFFNPALDDDLIEEVIRAAKTRNTYGVEVYVNPLKKSLFDAWNLAQTQENRLRYDMTNVGANVTWTAEMMPIIDTTSDL